MTIHYLNKRKTKLTLIFNDEGKGYHYFVNATQILEDVILISVFFLEIREPLLVCYDVLEDTNTLRYGVGDR